MIKKLISKFTDKVFLKFLLVGVINTVVGTTIMFVCYNVLSLSYWVSSAANYFFASILSFFLNKYFTFSNKDSSLMQIVKFAVNIAVCYVIAYGLAQKFALFAFGFLGEKLRNNLAMLVGMGLFTVLNYLGQRCFAFKTKTRGETEDEKTVQGD